MNEITTITIQKKTKERLDSLGRFRESYDDLLNRILDEFEEKRIDMVLEGDK